MLQDKAMLIRPSFSRPTATRKDVAMTKAAAEAMGMKKSRAKGTKTLYAGSAYDEIVSLDGEMRNFVYKYTLPWLDEGWRVCPTAVFFELMEGVSQRQSKREALIEKFFDQIPDIVATDAVELGAAFDPADYDISILQGKFKFDLIRMPIPRLGDFRLEGMDPEDVAKIEADTLKRVEEQLKPTDLWRRVHEAVSHISERLHAYGRTELGNVTGAFRDTLIDNLRDLVGILPKLNITNDADLAAMHKRLEQELCYHDPQVLREDDTIREDVATAADRILAEMSAFYA